MADEQVQGKTYGVEAGEQIMRASARWPRLYVKANERARFHSLSNGKDASFQVARFHVWGEFPNQKKVVCVRELSMGGEVCKYCEDGHQTNEGRFGIWVWCYQQFHATDNPNKEGEAWKSVVIEDRTLFAEEVNRPLLLDLKGGQKGKWFAQFTNEFAKHGTLQKHLYELYHQGESTDTDYILGVVEEKAIPPEILDKQEVKELPPVEQVYRSGAAFGPSTGTEAVLGKDALTKSDDGQAAAEPLPAAQPVSGSSANDADLI